MSQTVVEQVLTPEVPAPQRGRRPKRPRISAAPAWVGGIAGLLAVVVAWWVISFLFFRQDQSVPYPHRVAAGLVEAFGQASFWNAVAATVRPAALGYLWGNLIAFGLAAIVLVIPRLEGLVSQIAVVSTCIPLTAIGPILVLMSGPGSHFASVVLAALSVIFTSVIGIVLGLKAATPSQLDVIRVAGGGSVTELRKVRLIAGLPAILAALQMAAPAAVLGSILGEYFLLGVDSGLGIQLLGAQAHNQPVRLWVIGVACGGVAGTAYWAIGLLSKYITPWSTGAKA
ncbi:ABC transporter permease [Rhodococcus pyridinivorans]